MAVTKKTDAASVKKAAAKQQAPEALYSVEELAKAKERFHTSAVVIRAALKQKGKQFYSISEAESIVNTFKNEEVK